MFFEFDSVGINDPKWKDRIDFPDIGFQFTPSSGTFALYADMGYKMKSGETLDFFAKGAYSTAKNSIELAGSMGGMINDFMGVKGLSVGELAVKVACTITYPPVVDAFGIAGACACVCGCVCVWLCVCHSYSFQASSPLTPFSFFSSHTRTHMRTHAHTNTHRQAAAGGCCV